MPMTAPTTSSPARSPPEALGPKTKLYFYWGNREALAEETDGQGATLARYLVDGGDTMAQETYRAGSDGHRDPNDTDGTWTWLLDTPRAMWPPIGR